MVYSLCIVRLSEIGTGHERNFRLMGCGRGSESLIPPSTANESEISFAAGAYLRQSYNKHACARRSHAFLKVGGRQSRPNRRNQAFPCDIMQSRSASDQSLRVNLSQSHARTVEIHLLYL